jgi:hypothetical protein
VQSPLVALAFQQYGGDSGAGAIAGILGAGFALIWLAVAVLMVAACWKIFTKAGEPGWAAIVPIYNLVVLLKIVDKPLWWLILFLIPFVNFVAAILVTVALAEKFGKGVGFAVGMIVLPFVFYPILGFGDARYRR